MADQDDRVSLLQDDVSYLQQDMAKIGMLVDRLDITIDKLSEVSTSLSQLLAVHETKITAQDTLVKNVSDLVEKRREEMEQHVKLLHARISSGEKEMEDKLDDRAENILEELKEMRAESAKQHEALNNRITILEKWMWVVVGAFAVLNFLGGNIDLGAFLS